MAAAAGVAIAVAVLAGAYNVGESVRDSLRALALNRLGATQYAVTSNTSFREALLPECPLIALEAVVTHDASGRRASRVALYAVDQRFWKFHGRSVQEPGRNQFLLSEALAAELQAAPGDNLLVRVARTSAIPAESLHGRKDDPGRTIRGAAREVLSRESMGEFSLRAQQGPVHAIFVNLDRFQSDLEMDGKVNVSLTRSPPEQRVRTGATLEDVGVTVHDGMVSHASMMLDDALASTVRKADPQALPVFTYMANSIRLNGRAIPYSVVTAMDRPELGAENEIVLNEWAARDLQAKVGETITLEYYLWDPSGKLVTKSASFRYSGVVPIEEWQRHLAPDYPGISDAVTISDWDPPFPLDLGRIRKIDEDYWDKYRATPKALIRLGAGQKLWQSRYGSVTGMRSAVVPESLLASIDPLAILRVEDVRSASLQASQGATDFGEYFLYFSFFLVASALLLAGMFFRFGMEQRLPEISTLRALGWPVSQIRGLLLSEAMMVAVAGSVAGSIAAFGYSRLILYALSTWWVDAVGTRDLQMTFSPVSLLLGITAGLVVAGLVIFAALRLIGKRAPRETAIRTTHANVYAGVLAMVGVSLLGLGGAGGFFGAGAALLAAALIWIFGRLTRAAGRVTSVATLGVRYPAHRPGRAALCIALIASATFLIVAVDSFRRTGSSAEGGYRYIAETAIPIFHDPNAAAGRQALQLTTEAKWLSFRLRPGEDASCLNLYQPENPRVVGAPASWLTLEPQPDGTIPAAADANTLTYVLHRKLGDVMEVGNARVKFVRTLHDTVFQSEILIGDGDFQRVYPEEQGFRVFLVDAPDETVAQLEKALADYGFDATSVADRLAAFHRVENTYLSTFQFLGALGLLLGTMGLAAVLLRNLLERRRELALLRATGFHTAHLTRMILAENIFILLAGLGIGAVCAFLAVAPTVLQRGGSPPWIALLALVLAVFAVGLAASLLAVRIAVRAPILAALRSE